VWVESFAFHVVPGFFSVVSGVEVYGLGAPVVLLAWYVVATLQEEDVLT